MPVGDSEGCTPGGDSRPTPDPTSLTTEQLDKAVKGLRELLDSKIDGVTAVVEEKFDKMTLQFDLVERQRVEAKTDTKTAVDAALSAQKEAVREQTIASERAIAKSEASTSKQLDQISEVLTGGLSDLKERVGRIENMKAGGQQAYAGIYMLAGFIVLVLAIIGGIAAVNP